MRPSLILTFVLAALTVVSRADACSCAGPGLLCSAYWKTSAVFVGTVRDIQPVPERPRMLRIRFDVEQRGRGVTSDTAVLEAEPQDGVSCGYSFRIGVRYFVRAHATDGGPLSTGLCSGTKPASEAADELAFLREVTGPPRGVRIFGQVRRIEDDLASAGPRDRGGVANSRIVVSGSGGSRTALTGAEGTFDFPELAPGTYTVSATLPRGLAFAGPPLPPAQVQPPLRPITLANPSECANVWLSPRTDSRVTGVLLNAAGRPLAGELVDLIAAANASSPARTVRAVSVRTGSDGRFEFAFIASGSYLVGVNLTSLPPPSELDRRVTAPVSVEEGSRIEVGELRVPEWPSERRISGVVVSSDGTPAADARLTLFGAGPEEVRLDANGRFQISLAYGAKFALRAEASRMANGRRTTLASTRHEIGRNDRDAELTLTLGAGR